MSTARFNWATYVCRDMKICTVTPGINSDEGVSYVTRNLVHQLDQSGIDCYVITDFNSDPNIEPELRESVTQYFIKRPEGAFLRAVYGYLYFVLKTIFVLDRLIKEHDFDIIYSPGNLLLPVLVVAVSRRVRSKDTPPIVGGCHGTYLETLTAAPNIPSYKGKYAYLGKIFLDFLLTTPQYYFVDAIHAVSETTKSELITLGIDERKIFVVPNAINADETRYREDSIYQNDTIPEEEVIVLTVGRVEPLKGHHLLLDAITALHQEIPNLHLLVVGTQPYQRYNQYLQQKVQKSNLSDIVTFTNSIPHKDVLRMYHESDVFVCSSYSEGGPLVVLEAAATGCSIVSTDVGLVREALGPYGIYVERGNVDDLVNGIKEGLKAQENQVIQERILQQYTWEQSAKKLENLLYTIVSQNTEES